jgi:predicted dinucleotide-utilizing enzyme
MPVAYFSERFPYYAATTFTNAIGVARTNLLAAQTTPCRIDAIICANSEAVAHDVKLEVVIGGVNRVLGNFTIPASAGAAGVLAYDLIANLPAGLTAINLPVGAYLALTFAVAMTAGQTTDVHLFGGFA